MQREERDVRLTRVKSRVLESSADLKIDRSDVVSGSFLFVLGKIPMKDLEGTKFYFPSGRSAYSERQIYVSRLSAPLIRLEP